MAACGDSSARALTVATVDAGGVVGGSVVAVAVAAALAACGDDGKRALRVQAAVGSRWQRPKRLVATARVRGRR